MRTLPEIREFCRREVYALSRVMVLLTETEKRVARVIFRESFEGTQRGSHVQYRRQDGTRFSIVRPHGGNKTVNQNAVREVLERLGL